jgi:AcrR family transcriptional regulator
VSEARDRWLDEGITVLASEGAPGVRIDRIAARLGLSKGSFHHHFAGADGYKRALLARVEDMAVDGLENAIEDGATPGDARAILGRLTDLVGSGAGALYRPELDSAVRAWAVTDPDVRAVQERIDAARLAALQRVWRPHVATDDDARRAAQLPYLLAVGAAAVVPPVEAEELREVFARILLPLVPDGATPGA